MFYILKILFEVVTLGMLLSVAFERHHSHAIRKNIFKDGYMSIEDFLMTLIIIGLSIGATTLH